MDVAKVDSREKRKYQPRTIRVRPEDLESTSGIRRLSAKIADAVSRGVLSPGRATAMLQSIRVGTASELEAADRLERMMAQRQLSTPTPRTQLRVIDAKVEEVA